LHPAGGLFHGGAMQEGIYTAGDIRKTYEKVHDLLVTKQIIKAYSTNRRDIRDAVLCGLRLPAARRVLDLGCGFGFFIEKLKGLLPGDASITGIDLVGGYERPYLDTVASAGYSGSFVKGDAGLIMKMEDGSRDLVISSYSLYFFPHLIGDIHRILDRDGVFIALTHSRHSLREAIEFVGVCMRKLGLDFPGETALSRLLMTFSLENGSGLLDPFFGRVEKIIYRNSMVFGIEHVDDCIYYLEKKRNLIYKEALDRYPERVADLESCITASIWEYAKAHGRVTFSKDDGVFICYKDGKAIPGRH
jgi:SAM-dependent methyltransferase